MSSWRQLANFDHKLHLFPLNYFDGKGASSKGGCKKLYDGFVLQKIHNGEFLSLRVALDCGDVLDDLSIVQWGLYVTRHANVITRDRLFRRNNKGFVHLDHQEIILGPKMLDYKYLCRNKPGRPIQNMNVSKHVDCGQDQ